LYHLSAFIASVTSGGCSGRNEGLILPACQAVFTSDPLPEKRCK